MRIIIAFERGIGDFHLRGKGLRAEGEAAYGALRLHQIDQLRGLRIAHQGAVLHQVHQVLQGKLLADFFNELVFAHVALAQILAEHRLAEFAGGIVKAGIIDNNLLDLLVRHADAHHFRALNQIGALQQRIENHIAPAVVAGGLSILQRNIERMVADFFIAHFGNIIGAGCGHGAHAEADESQRD